MTDLAIKQSEKNLIKVSEIKQNRIRNGFKNAVQKSDFAEFPMVDDASIGQYYYKFHDRDLTDSNSKFVYVHSDPLSISCYLLEACSYDYNEFDWLHNTNDILKEFHSFVAGWGNAMQFVYISDYSERGLQSWPPEK